MYASQIKDKTLIFSVSGKLWNRSLIMLDQQTKSQWSQILGKAMAGPMKGTRLESLPCDMVTWEAWHRDHPETTVLDMPRSAKAFTQDFYRQAKRFAYGFTVKGQAYHCTVETLRTKPVHNLTLQGEPLLLTFDSGSTSVRLFSRRVDGKTLTFDSGADGGLTDRESKSTWNRATGAATAGPMKGKSLDHRAGIMSFTHKWTEFYLDSEALRE